MFTQLVYHDFCNFGRISIEPAASVHELLLIALDDPTIVCSVDTEVPKEDIAKASQIQREPSYTLHITYFFPFV